MEKRAEITISGRVQKAGFKDFIDEIAFNLDLNGYVKNLGDGTVQVVCEGEEELIREFLEKINITEYPVRVEKIEVVYKEPTREYGTFDVIMDEDLTTAIYERMDAALRCLREMNSGLVQKTDRKLANIEEMSLNLDQKIDRPGEKTDLKNK